MLDSVGITTQSWMASEAVLVEQHNVPEIFYFTTWLTKTTMIQYWHQLYIIRTVAPPIVLHYTDAVRWHHLWRLLQSVSDKSPYKTTRFIIVSLGAWITQTLHMEEDEQYQVYHKIILHNNRSYSRPTCTIYTWNICNYSFRNQYTHKLTLYQEGSH